MRDETDMKGTEHCEGRGRGRAEITGDVLVLEEEQEVVL